MRRASDERATALPSRLQAIVPSLIALVPSLIAIVLALPGFKGTWVMDDFDFLAAAQVFRPSMLLPDPGSFFYRPLSRELYFGALMLLPRGRLFLAHALNAALLGACAFLIADIGTRLLGRRGGLVTGLAFAALGAAPLLVAWPSESQDLLAILLSLVALRLQLSGRPIPASLAMAGALLSKETSVAFLPVAALLPWILGSSPRHRTRQWLPHAAVLLLWLAIHPAPRLIGIGHAAVGGEPYIGVGAPWRGSALVGTLLTMFNAPLTGTSTPWPESLTILLVLAIALVGAGFGLIREGRPAPKPGFDQKRVILLGGLLTLCPLLVTTALVSMWSPRLAMMPAVGSSLLLGALMANWRPGWAALALTAFLALGVWSRNADPDPPVLCERYLADVSGSLQRVEAGFKTLHPSFPPEAYLLVSVAGTGSRGVWTNLHRFQALRAWYSLPGLRTLLPERRLGEHPEFLFRITRALDVIEIEPDRCLFRSSGGAPDPDQVGRTIRTYARGVAATGEGDRAVRMLTRLAELDGGLTRGYDLRLAAMIELSQGKSGEARQFIARSSDLPRAFCLDMVGKVLAEPSRNAAVDSFAFGAFGVSSSDTAVIGYLMRMYWRSGYPDQARDLASRMRHLAPGDSESARIVRSLSGRKTPVRITSPPSIDSM